MTKKPKPKPEFTLQSEDDRLDDLAAEILSIVRSKAVNPAEALTVIEMVIYMIIKSQGADVKKTLGDIVANVMILHATNDIKGTA